MVLGQFFNEEADETKMIRLHRKRPHLPEMLLLWPLHEDAGNKRRALKSLAPLSPFPERKACALVHNQSCGS